MFINSLIIALHLTLIFSENPAKDCNYYEAEIAGCRFQNTIVVSYFAEDVDRTFKEEFCHAVINQNQEILNSVYSYPDLRAYFGYTDEEINGEKAADYCIKYMDKTLDAERYQEFNALMDYRTATILATDKISL